MARICVRLCVSSEYNELVANFILGGDENLRYKCLIYRVKV